MNGLEAKEAADKIRRLANPALQQTLNETVRVLGENGIPSLVVGGVAVQEYGYPRSTIDVDLVVPDPKKAQEILLNNGYTKGKVPLTVLAPNSVEVDLLKAGEKINASKVPNPTPTAVTTSPQFCDLTDLIDLKIGSYMADAAIGGTERYHDRTDVMKLVQSRNLPRDFLQGKIQQRTYEQLWDFLNNPKPQKEASIVDLYPEKSYTGPFERGTMKTNSTILAAELAEVAGVKTLTSSGVPTGRGPGFQTETCWSCGNTWEFYMNLGIVPPCPRCGAGAAGTAGNEPIMKNKERQAASDAGVNTTFKYEVIVSNVGLVYDGTDSAKADEVFANYVDISKSGQGRAGHESVTMLVNDEISTEYQGDMPTGDDIGDIAPDSTGHTSSKKKTRKTADERSDYDKAISPNESNWWESGKHPCPGCDGKEMLLVGNRQLIEDDSIRAEDSTAGGVTMEEVAPNDTTPEAQAALVKMPDNMEAYCGGCGWLGTWADVKGEVSNTEEAEASDMGSNKCTTCHKEFTPQNPIYNSEANYANGTYRNGQCKNCAISTGHTSSKKKARMLVPEEQGTTPALQRIVGDPDDQVTSPFTQFKPNPGNMQIPNPLSPVQGDEIFFCYLIAGARFQCHDGSWYEIIDYNYANYSIEIENCWYPRIHAVVSVWDVRRAIHSWIEPVQVLIPPPPPGVDYDIMRARIVK